VKRIFIVLEISTITKRETGNVQKLSNKNGIQQTMTTRLAILVLPPRPEEHLNSTTL